MEDKNQVIIWDEPAPIKAVIDLVMKLEIEIKEVLDRINKRLDVLENKI
jgi:hypothetical protein